MKLLEVAVTIAHRQLATITDAAIAAQQLRVAAEQFRVDEADMALTLAQEVVRLRTALAAAKAAAAPAHT